MFASIFASVQFRAEKVNSDGSKQVWVVFANPNVNSEQSHVYLRISYEHELKGKPKSVSMQWIVKHQEYSVGCVALLQIFPFIMIGNDYDVEIPKRHQIAWFLTASVNRGPCNTYVVVLVVVGDFNQKSA